MTTQLSVLRVSLEIAERAIALAQAQLPPPRPPSPDGVILQPGDDVQAAIDAAAPNARLLFVPGARYVVGTLRLANKPITLTSAETLPARRITPDDAPLLPILASGYLDKTIDGTNASGLVIDGLAFESRSDGLGDILVFQDALRVRLDRILIIAGTNGQKRAIRGNGQGIALTRSHIANVWRDGQDSQCFCAWDGAGPYAILDNYLEAAGENVMFGGSDSAAADRVPSYIVIHGNTFRKRHEWVGTGKAVKNLLEFKAAQHVRVYGNDFSGNWTDAQNGYAILIKSVNQDGGSPWTATTDLAFENNLIADTDAGINVLGYDPDHPSGQTTRITIRDNRITCRGTGLQAGGGIGDLTIDKNLIDQGGNLLTLYGSEYAVDNLIFTNNQSNDVPYGIKGDGTASGTDSLDHYCHTYTYEGNTYTEGSRHASTTDHARGRGRNLVAGNSKRATVARDLQPSDRVAAKPRRARRRRTTRA